MRTIRPLPGRVIVSVVDLEEHVATAPDGTPFRYQVDPATGLALAPDRIHPPVGVVVARHEDITLELGARVIAQRNLGREFVFEGMRCLDVMAAGSCSRCGTVALGCGHVPALEHKGDWQPREGWTLVELCRLEDTSAIASVHPGVDVGRVIYSDYGSEPPLYAEQVVCFGKTTGIRWSEGGTDYVALRLHVRCPTCGCTLQGSEVHGLVEGGNVVPTSGSYAV